MLNNGNAEHMFYALCVIDFTRTLTFIDFQGIVLKIRRETKEKFTVKNVKVISIHSFHSHCYLNASICISIKYKPTIAH